MKAWELFFLVALFSLAGIIISVGDAWAHWLVLSIGGVGVVSVILAIVLHSKNNKQYFQ